MPKFELEDFVFKKTKDFFFAGRVLCTFFTLDNICCCVVQDPQTRALFVALEKEFNLVNPRPEPAKETSKCNGT